MALFAGDTGEIKPEVRDQINTKVLYFFHSFPEEKVHLVDFLSFFR